MHYYYRKETNENITSLINDLSKENWIEIYSEKNDVDRSYNLFHHKFMQYYDKNIPRSLLKKFQQKIRKPWITRGLMKYIRTKNRLFKLYIRNPNNVVYHEKFKKYRNKLTSLIRISRQMFYANKLQNVTGNVSAVWRVINDILHKGKKPVIPTELTYDNVSSRHPKDSVNLMNKYL